MVIQVLSRADCVSFQCKSTISPYTNVSDVACQHAPLHSSYKSGVSNPKLPLKPFYSVGFLLCIIIYLQITVFLRTYILS